MTLVAMTPMPSTSATVIRIPSPGTRRPSIRSESGAVKPSMIPKIQTSAETLTTSGTATKKPVMNRRRSHVAYRHPAAIAAKSSTPSAIRYQAKGAKPARVTYRRNGRMTTARGDERRHEADGDLGRPVGGQLVPDLEQVVDEGAGHGRHGQEEGKLGRDGTVQAQQHAADDGGARTRHAGHERQHLAGAHGRGARPSVSCSERRSRSARGRHRSAASITRPPEHEGPRHHGRAVIEDRLHVVGQQGARHERRHAGQRPPPARTAGRAPGCGSPTSTSHTLARYSHTTASTAPSWIITVNTPPGS